MSFPTDVATGPPVGDLSPPFGVSIEVSVPVPPASATSYVGPWQITPGATTLRPGPPEVFVRLYDGDDLDRLTLSVATQQIDGSGLDSVSGDGVAQLLIDLDAPPGTLPSTSLTVLPAVSWSGGAFYFSYYVDAASEGYYEPSGALGTITSIEVIPEPATALLFGAGLAAIAARRTARSHARR